MTVAELIAKLQEMPQDAPVMRRLDSHEMGDAWYEHGPSVNLVDMRARGAPGEFDAVLDYHRKRFGYKSEFQAVLIE